MTYFCLPLKTSLAPFRAIPRLMTDVWLLAMCISIDCWKCRAVTKGRRYLQWSQGRLFLEGASESSRMNGRAYRKNREGSFELNSCWQG